MCSPRLKVDYVKIILQEYPAEIICAIGKGLYVQSFVTGMVTHKHTCNDDVKQF